MKTSFLTLVSLFLMVIVFAGGCEGCIETYYSLIVKNQSSKEISFYISRYGSQHIYPDTLLPTDKPSMLNVKPNGYEETDSYSSRWEDRFNALPSDTLSFFVFDTQQLDTTSWAKIRDEYKILKRYDFSLRDLQQLDFNITYPPDARMLNVKKYPK